MIAIPLAIINIPIRITMHPRTMSGKENPDIIKIPQAITRIPARKGWT